VGTIELRTELTCSCARAFALAVDLDLQLRVIARCGGGIVGGRRCGRIGPGETVTWGLRWFGAPLRHTSLISEYDAPTWFVDEMVRGIFARFRHEHRLLPKPDGGCTMLDRVDYRLPGGVLGVPADRLVARRWLRRMLLHRNAEIRRGADQDK
jgi:ligand-binding SRPBCC domain-containing protein